MDVTNFKSVVELLDTFKDEQSCIEHLEWLRWDGNVVSPFDPTSVVYKCKKNVIAVKTQESISTSKPTLFLTIQRFLFANGLLPSILSLLTRKAYLLFS